MRRFLGCFLLVLSFMVAPAGAASCEYPNGCTTSPTTQAAQETPHRAPGSTQDGLPVTGADVLTVALLAAFCAGCGILIIHLIREK